jgi:hypothetical protein
MIRHRPQGPARSARPYASAGRTRCTRRTRRPPLFWVLVAMALASLAPTNPSRAEEIRIDLEKRGESHVTPRVRPDGFSLDVRADGHPVKLEPTTIRIDTQQQGRWLDVQLDAGRYLRTQYDPERPTQIRIESTLKFDLNAGDQRFARERDAIQREAQTRAGGKDAAALARARQQLMMERIAAIRAENVKAGANPRGRTIRHAPPLPRAALEFDKPEAVERILREQCRWQGVAQVFQATGFPPPDEKEHPDFAASQTMAEEIQQAVLGIRGAGHKILSDNQQNAIVENSRYVFAARFVPAIPGAASDLLWKSAPAVRLQDALVRRARLEGTLDRERGRVVEWWRVESDEPQRIDAQLTMGDGDCFWTWVEGPDPEVRFVRLLLHSPATRYRLTVSLPEADRGEEVTLYDGPLGAPDKAPY